MNRKWKLGDKSEPRNLRHCARLISQMIDDEGQSYREIDGMVRDTGACLRIRALQTARALVLEAIPSTIAILCDGDL